MKNRQYIIDRIRLQKDRKLISDVDNVLWFQKNPWDKNAKPQNFGDFLSPIIVHHTLRMLKIQPKSGQKKLAAVGSILHFAHDGDVVWGSGINGKVPAQKHMFTDLDIRAVRGPLTRNFLMQRGLDVPKKYGDPALLLPKIFPKLQARPQKGKIIFIPNLNDLPLISEIPEHIQLVSPLAHYKRVLDEILSSELVIASSLHGIIIAEAFGVPVRFVMPAGGETIDKYQDYIEGTGRKLTTIPAPFNHEPLSKNSGVTLPPLEFDATTLLDTFPRDIYT